MRGRKPKTVEQKILEGNPGKQRLPSPVRIAEKPTKPEDLPPPPDMVETAREWWEQAVPVLIEVGLIEQVDRATLEMMAVQYSRAKQAGRVLAEEGIQSRGSMGQVTEHPMMATERAAATTFNRLAEQYGLTPTARARLGLAELQRRSLAHEMEETLGKPKLKRVADGNGDNGK